MNTRRHRRHFSFSSRNVEIQRRYYFEFFGASGALYARNRAKIMRRVLAFVAPIIRVGIIIMAGIAYLAIFYTIALLNPIN